MATQRAYQRILSRESRQSRAGAGKEAAATSQRDREAGRQDAREGTVAGTDQGLSEGGPDQVRTGSGKGQEAARQARGGAGAHRRGGGAGGDPRAESPGIN